MTKPTARFLADWDNNLHVCPDARPGDELSIMHSLLTPASSDTSLENLHWAHINTAGTSGQSVTLPGSESDYGIRAVRCATTSDTGAGIPQRETFYNRMRDARCYSPA